MKKNFILKFFSFFAGGADTADKIHSRISPRIFEKPEMVLMGYSGARGTLIYEKNLKSKMSFQTPFKFTINTNQVDQTCTLQVHRGLSVN
jgi:hypothetical protein